VISKPFKEGFFGDTPNPGRGLAALCTPADFHHSSAGFEKRDDWGTPQTPAEGWLPSALPLR